jgi:hypothetical protein
MNDANREYQRPDVLDDIDAAVAQITDDQVEERLRETLRRAADGPGQPAGAGADPAWLVMRA